MPVGALFLITVVFFYDVLAGDFLFIERDLYSFSLPPKVFWVESLARGDFPLWNPYNLFGHPFFATLQQAILYPLNIIFFILPFPAAFNWSIILHVFLGGAFLYALLRDMEANTWASFIGAVSFMLGGYLLSVHDLLPTLVSVVWTPLIFLYFRRALNDDGILNALITGVLLTVSFLGGGAEAVFGCLIALAAMVVVSPAGRGRTKTEGAVRLGVAVLVFLGLSAVQILPFLELSGQSIRAGGISYEEATIWSLAPWDLMSLIITDPYGYRLSIDKYWTSQNWLKTLYIGFLPLLLSAFYFLKGGRERLLWLSIVFISVFLAFGSFNPLHTYVFHYAPLFSKLRYPVKFFSLAMLAVSITAGLGMHMLMESRNDRERRRFIHAVFILAFVAAVALLLLILGHDPLVSVLKARGIDEPVFNRPEVNLYNAKRSLFYLALFGVLLKAGFEKQWKRWITAALCIVLVGDLFGNMGYYQKMEAAEYFRPSWAMARVASDTGLHRVFVTPKTTAQKTFIAPDISPFDAPKQLLAPSMNLVHRIHDVRGAEVMRIKRVEDVYNAFATSPAIDATNLAGLFNIKYVLSTIPIPSQEYTRIAAHTEGLEGNTRKLMNQATIKLYKNLRFLPRAFLVDAYEVLRREEETVAAMKMKSFRPDRLVYVEEEPQWHDMAAARVGRKEVTILEHSNNRMRLTVKTPRRSLLVVTDTYYPGWKVIVDGRARKIYRADNAFRAVPLGPGNHDVEFVYAPASVRWGLVISIFTVSIICLGGAIYYTMRRKLRQDRWMA